MSLAPLCLTALLTLGSVGLVAQDGRFLKIEINSASHEKADKSCKKRPENVQIRVPVRMAKSVLEIAQDSKIKINGESKKEIKLDALIKMLEGSKGGDLLLEITSSDGNHVKVTVE